MATEQQERVRKARRAGVRPTPLFEAIVAEQVVAGVALSLCRAAGARHARRRSGAEPFPAVARPDAPLVDALPALAGVGPGSVREQGGRRRSKAKIKKPPGAAEKTQVLSGQVEIDTTEEKMGVDEIA